MNFLFLKPVFLIYLLFWMGSPLNHSQKLCSEDVAALTPAPLEEEWAVEWWMPRHEEKLNEEGRESANLLFWGDSITHGWETAGKQASENYFSNYNIHNIGFSGDRTENVLWRIEHGALDNLNPELTVVMIGTNNTGHRQDSPECTAKGIETILEELNERLPNSHVLLLAIFPRSESPDDELRQLNQEINQKIEKFGEREWVTFLDINHVFLDEDGVLSEEIMPDMLHPNEYGYELWAEAMEPTLRQWFGK